MNSPLFSNPDDIEHAKEALRLKKTVSVDSYNSRCFDLMDEASSEEYAKLMLEIIKKVQTGEVVIWNHSRMLTNRNDGSNTLSVFIEWSEYGSKEYSNDSH